jgi:hypothetical protein
MCADSKKFVIGLEGCPDCKSGDVEFSFLTKKDTLYMASANERVICINCPKCKKNLGTGELVQIRPSSGFTGLIHSFLHRAVVSLCKSILDF